MRLGPTLERATFAIAKRSCWRPPDALPSTESDAAGPIDNTRGRTRYTSRSHAAVSANPELMREPTAKQSLANTGRRSAHAPSPRCAVASPNAIESSAFETIARRSFDTDRVSYTRRAQCGSVDVRAELVVAFIDPARARRDARAVQRMLGVALHPRARASTADRSLAVDRPTRARRQRTRRRALSTALRRASQARRRSVLAVRRARNRCVSISCVR